MTAVATAIVGSAVIGAYASNQAAKAQAKGVENGLTAQERMSDKNLEFQREMEEQQRSDFQPWRDAGETALQAIEEGIASGAFEVGAINLTDDPGYQVRMQAGIDALDSSAAARGRLNSGAQDKAITSFAQDQGSQEYANAYARELQQKQQKFNILSGISQGGQSSAAQQSQATSQLASSGGNIMTNLGNTQTVAANNTGAINATAYQEGAQIVNQAAQNWLTYKQPSSTTGVNNNTMAGNAVNQSNYGTVVA